MFAVAERISSDVICSTEPGIIYDWKNTRDQLLIFRRPDYDAAGIQAYIDYLAANHPLHIDQLHKLNFSLSTHNMALEPETMQDIEKLSRLGIYKDIVTFADLFPGEPAGALLRDIEKRMATDVAKVFPQTPVLKLRLRTQADPENMYFHVDRSPILGYTHGKFNTEFLHSNEDMPPGRASYPGLKLNPSDIQPHCIRHLEPGDVSIMKNKPHRGMGDPRLQPKIWMGLCVNPA